MPIPTPRSGENKNTFISRCMSNDTMVDEYDQKQRIAICQSQWRDRLSNIENVFINNTIDSYTPRNEIFKGRNYLIAPATILVEGVHCGTKGCLFYSQQLLRDCMNEWNGVPILIDHPLDENGDITDKYHANDTHIANNQMAGNVYNVRLRGDKLKCELWFDEERLIELDSDLHNNIKLGNGIEVSTGIFLQRVDEGGVWNGEEYAAKVDVLKPDHLAVLRTAQGACSINDGCGIRNVEKGVGDEMTIVENVNNPKYKGTETKAWGEVNKSMDAFIAGYFKHTNARRPEEPIKTVRDMPLAMKKWIANKTLDGDANADTVSELIRYPVVNPGTNKLNRGAVIAAKGRATQQGLRDVAKRADTLFKKEFKVDNVVEKVTGFVEKFLSERKNHTLNETSLTDMHEMAVRLLDSMDNDIKRYYLEELYSEWLVYKIGPGPLAPEGTESVLFKVDYSINDEGKMEFTSEPVKVTKSIEYTEMQNVKGGDLEMSDEKNEKEQLINALVECKCTQWGEGDKEFLNTLNVEALGKMSVVEHEEKKVDNEKVDGDKTSSDKPTVDNTESDKPIDKPVEKPAEKTAEQFLADAPDNVRELFGEGLNLLEKQKGELIESIMNAEGNVFDSDTLNQKRIDELKAIAALITKPEKAGNNYAGAGGVGNVAKNDSEPLTVPDWAANLDK